MTIRQFGFIERLSCNYPLYYIIGRSQNNMNGKVPFISFSKFKEKQKVKKDNKRIARTRRQRGYNWEDTLVKRFNSVENWKAFRLGSPSVALPDVLAVNNNGSIIFTIEAKSGTSTSLLVPADQIKRCQKWIRTFEIYRERKVILAFKFLSKKRIGTGQYENRQLREFFKVWDESLQITDCVCTYHGELYTRIDGKREKLNLLENSMPFKTKQRIVPTNLNDSSVF